MSFFSRILLVVLLFFFIGCGGGGSTLSNNSDDMGVKAVHISDAQKMNITKENALELYTLSVKYIPSYVGFERWEIEDIIHHNINETIKCEQGGEIKISVNQSSYSMSLAYNQCKLSDSLKMNGMMTFEIEENTEEEKTIIDRISAENLVITENNYAREFHYVISSCTDNAYMKEEVKNLDYYVYMKDLQTQDKLEFNIFIDQDEFKTEVTGNYLLNNLYFTLTSEGLSPGIGLSWSYMDDEFFFEGFIAKGGKILLPGVSQSVLEYQNATDFNIFKFIEDDNIFYAEDNESDWTTDLHDIVPNNYNPSVYLQISDKNVGTESSASPVLLLDQNHTLNILVKDEDSFSEYATTLELIKSPVDSNQFNYKKDITLKKIGAKREYQSNVAINFDEEGTYNYKLRIKDGDRIVEKKFSFEYYQSTSLAENQYIFSGNIKDSVFIPKGNHMAILSTNPTNKLTIIDQNGEYTSSLNLPNTSLTMAINEDNDKLAITSGDNVIWVDISDISNPYILKTFALPTALADIAVHENYIYVVENTSNSSGSLYSLNTTNGLYSSLEYAMSSSSIIKVNHSNEAIYIREIGHTPQDIEKFDISLGEARKLYDSPYHGEFYFGNDLWMLTDSILVTANGIKLSMNISESEDMLYLGRMFSRNILVEYGSYYLTRIKDIHVNSDLGKVLISTGTAERYINTQRHNEYQNVLELQTITGSVLPYRDVLKKYYIDSEGEEFTLFIQNAKLISNNKVFVIYRAVPKYEVGYSDNDIFIFETKNLE